MWKDREQLGIDHTIVHCMTVTYAQTTISLINLLLFVLYSLLHLLPRVVAVTQHREHQQQHGCSSVSLYRSYFAECILTLLTTYTGSWTWIARTTIHSAAIWAIHTSAERTFSTICANWFSSIQRIVPLLKGNCFLGFGAQGARRR